MRLVQLKAGDVRRVAVVEEPKLRLLREFDSMYALAQAAIASGGKLTSVATNHLTDDSLDYEPVYEGTGQWRLLARAQA
jgi:hypothetical protein